MNEVLRDKAMALRRAMFEARDERDRLRAAVDAALELTDPDFNPIPVRQVRGRAGWKFAMEHVRAALAAADPNTEENQ